MIDRKNRIVAARGLAKNEIRNETNNQLQSFAFDFLPFIRYTKYHS